MAWFVIFNQIAFSHKIDHSSKNIKILFRYLQNVTQTFSHFLPIPPALKNNETVPILCQFELTIKIVPQEPFDQQLLRVTFVFIFFLGKTGSPHLLRALMSKTREHAWALSGIETLTLT